MYDFCCGHCACCVKFLCLINWMNNIVLFFCSVFSTEYYSWTWDQVEKQVWNFSKFSQTNKTSWYESLLISCKWTKFVFNAWQYYSCITLAIFQRMNSCLLLKLPSYQHFLKMRNSCWTKKRSSCIIITCWETNSLRSYMRLSVFIGYCSTWC